MIKTRTLAWNRLMMGGIGLLLCGGLAACGSSTTLLPGPSADVLPPVTDPASPGTPTTPATNEPPAVSGGALLITHDSLTAVAADPDRDSVWLADLQNAALRKRVKLPAGSEPGRVVEDTAGNVHVATRRGGQVVTINPQSGEIVASRAVCAAPRGLAYDAASGNLYVACNGGELVTLPAAGSGVTRTVTLDRDLRDVVVKGDHLLISRFRSAELIEVDASGSVVGRVKPRQSPVADVKDPNGKTVTTSPNTAWRTKALADGSVLMLHQRALDSTISTLAFGYSGGTCKSGIVDAALTLFNGGGSAGALSVGSGGIAVSMPVAVDVAESPDGKQVAIINAGSGSIFSSIAYLTKSAMTPSDGCQFPNASPRPDRPDLNGLQLIAGAYDGSGNLWVQARNPARLLNASASATIDFTGAEDRSSPGHALFHSPTKSAIACVSCHAEAGDDGHVWNFDTVGPRRTQSLRGGILATAPFHWDGDMTDLTVLMNQVFTGRMGGGTLAPSQVSAIGAWADAQPSLPKSPPRDPAAVERGKTLFNDPAVGCASCHSGAHFTNNLNLLVGTGKTFQVPSLIDVAARAPFIHTGCAATLRDRFDPACGGGDSHGKTSQLSSTQIDDLVSYLETL